MNSVAIGAVMKQEADYILEWVYYHKALGFDLIIADNGGDDDTSKILNSLQQANMCHRIDVRPIKNQPQIPAYRAILRFARKMNYSIVGFLDCDEFFTRYFPVKTLNPEDGAEYILSEFEKKQATQLSFFSICYGSKTDYQNISLPVLQRFSYHSKFEEYKNIYIKSFVKVNEMFKIANVLFLGPRIYSPHFFHDARKQWYIENEKIIGFSYHKAHHMKISHQTGAILHYQILTWEEYQRKIYRGYAIRKFNKNSKDYFDKNDFNDIKSEVDENIIKIIRSGVGELRDLIGDCENEQEYPNFLENIQIRMMSFGISNVSNSGLSKLSTLIYRMIRKFIKILTQDDSYICL